jgi:hypothetical protein
VASIVTEGDRATVGLPHLMVGTNACLEIHGSVADSHPHLDLVVTDRLLTIGPTTPYPSRHPQAPERDRLNRGCTVVADNVLFAEQDGTRAAVQIQVFEDT